MGDKKRVFIVDGYGQIYRSYFAFINSPMKDREGRNVSAVFGFFNTIMSLVQKYSPDYLVVAMDSHGKTFRHELYDQYKANRDKAPEDLHSQVPVISSILDAMRIPHFSRVGMEADDIIATIAGKASTKGIETVMVTGDKDLLQLVRDDVFALRPPRKGEKEYRLCNESEVHEIFGVLPSQIVDYLTILGDSSDNVPGIDGIGEKGAVKLLSDYGTLENAYANMASLPKGVAAKLEAARDHIGLSHALVVLKDDILPQEEIDFESFKVSSIDWNEGIRQFKALGSASLMKTAQRLVPADSFSLMAEDATPVEKIKEEETSFEERGLDGREIIDLLAGLADRSTFALQLKTSDEDDMRSSILGVSFSFDGNIVYSLPWTEDLKEAFSRNLPRFHLVGQDLKSLCKVLRRNGVAEAKPYADTMLAQWLLNTDLSRFEKESCIQSFRSITALETRLATEGLLDVFRNLEMPVCDVLCNMELNGILLDSAKMGEYGSDIEKEINGIREDIFTLCGKEFNLNSPLQLQEVLFVDRNLPTGKKTKSGFSTDSDVLENLADTTEDPVPALLLRYRVLSKLLGTYVQALPQMINPETGRLHTSFLQTGTATGRLSSKNPNLQNIPIRTEDGRRIRDAFVPAPGCTLMSADYSQVELVVLSHVTGDENLRSAFREGQDVHRQTAAKIYGIFPELVTPEQRRAAKTINFGIMYGMSAFRLAGDLGISRKEAQNFIDTYFEHYSGVKTFVESTKAIAHEKGYVKTMMGHIRHIAEIRSSNKVTREAAERAAVNTVIQGSAAEIVKKSMIDIFSQMRSLGLKSRMLLQVHDEVIFEVPANEVETMRNLVRSCMENAVKLSVPLRVSIETGASWGEMH